MDVQDEPAGRRPDEPTAPAGSRPDEPTAPAGSRPDEPADPAGSRPDEPAEPAGRRHEASGPAGRRPEEPAGFITVDVEGFIAVDVEGRSRRLPAEHDYTGDGRPDAAVERPDGTVVVFADVADNETGAPDPDGRADEAYVVDKRSGRAIGAAHLDPETGEWIDESEGGGAS